MSEVVKSKKFKATPVENKENDVPATNNSQRNMSSTIVKSSASSFRSVPAAMKVVPTTTVLMPSDGDYSSHPRYLQIMSMKVAELKKELKGSSWMAPVSRRICKRDCSVQLVPARRMMTMTGNTAIR